MKNTKPKKYLLFMFGAWIRLEDNIELYEHIIGTYYTINTNWRSQRELNSHPPVNSWML